MYVAEPQPWDANGAGDLDLSTPVGACCYGSRLLGSEPSFVLHGGGNTSVKAAWNDITGRQIEALFVKGSGWDLATIEPEGFAPLRLSRLLELLDLEKLSDEDMARELAAAKLDPGAPSPSVESLLHAFLPFAAVQHSHADVIVSLTNTAHGSANVRAVFGDEVVVVPYAMPGFDLARLSRQMWTQQYAEGMIGMVLLNHGLFTFGASTAEAYQRHSALIDRAQRWLADQPAANEPGAPAELTSMTPAATARFRGRISRAAGRPMIMAHHSDAQVARFVGRADMASLATRGPLTPDHVIRTKRLPMVGTDVEGYVADYSAYFARNASRANQELTMLDPAPRVVLDARHGMYTLGTSAAAAGISEDIYRHTIEVLSTVECRLGGYVALDESDIFDTEYWDLEQAKLRRAGAPPPLGGQVALVTGAASGIGRACAEALAERGAAVVAIDIDPRVVEDRGPGWLGLAVDVTDDEAVADAVAATTERFGGVDIAVIAAGIFPPSQKLGALDSDQWRRAMAVNLDSVAVMFGQLEAVLAEAPKGGRVVIIGSKNAAAPGRGAAAYSASKAALTQLGRVAALEWAEKGIRVNIIHPDAVFDTGLWSDNLIEQRATSYGMTPHEYKTRNLLSTEVTSRTVAQLAAELCGPAFVATTGAQIPVDGGSDRVI